METHHLIKTGIAHKNEQTQETILEHGTKCLSYGDRFSLLNNFNSRFSLLLSKVISGNLTDPKNVTEYYIKNIKDVLVYHDFGKVNTSFQGVITGKLNKTAFQREHSIGSSAIYLYEKLTELDKIKLSKLETSYLTMFIYLNSWVISRHHSSLNNYNDYIDRLYEYTKSLKFNELEDYARFPEMLTYYNEKNNLKQEFDLRLVLTRKKFNGEPDVLDTLLFLYVKLVFGLLCQSDYLATGDFMSGSEFKLEDVIKEFNVYENKQRYNESPIMVSIQKNKNNDNLDSLNKLRLTVNNEVISTYTNNSKDNSYLIEAMTGIGKTNISVDLGLRIMEDKGLKKMLYIFPYNAIVDQTRSFIENNLGISGEVINSITPITLDNLKSGEGTDSEDDDSFNTLYLNRLMLNVDDGLLLTSHVNLGNILFGLGKDSAINLINITDSLIIMDEIHSYNSDLWEVYLKSLEIYKEILGLELVYMSATMPNFSKYINATKLVPNFSTYTRDPIYLNKFDVKLDLLNKKGLDIFEGLLDLHKVNSNRKNLVSFINKKDAHDFYNYMKSHVSEDIYLLTGDSSKKERLATIEKINNSESILVIATQVIEVGVDIDMDVCYGNLRPASSLEQLLGRLNRNNKKTDCLFYLFCYSSPDFIYKGSYIQSPNELLKVIKSRDYTMEYFDVLQGIKGAKGIFEKKVEPLTYLKYKDFSNGMKLIESNMVTVFLNDSVESEQVWKGYIETFAIADYYERNVLLFNARVRLTDYTCSVPESYVKKYNFSDSYANGYYVLSDKIWLTK